MMTTPRATYRLQLTEDFGFDRAAALVPYLANLGISHLYLSPVLRARPGSRHFYDVADHSMVDPVLGGEDGLRALAKTAEEAGLGLIGDIVPNHMGVGPWAPLWESLLSEGRSSRAADFFDVDWEPPLPGATDKVILPVLDDSYGDVLAAGGLTLTETSKGVRIAYRDLSFPIAQSSASALERSGLDDIVGVPDQPRTWGRMHSLLEQQHYRLVSWRAGTRLVNYRRYLNIDAMAALQVDAEAVFDETHTTMLRLVGDGVFDGLRVDHIDGLADPARYLQRLREQVGADVWLVVETFKASNDDLPHDWPVNGTTGYEVLRASLGLQVDPVGLLELRRHAQDHDAMPAISDRWRMKADMLDGALGPDLRRCTRLFWNACQEEPGVRDVDYRTLLEAVSRLATGLPRYRTYVDPKTGKASAADLATITQTVDQAKENGSRGMVPERLWAFLQRLLTGEVKWTAATADAVGRFQQLSGPVTALGVEERLFHTHHVLVAACELGCDPDDVARTLDQAHGVFSRLAPAGMRTTSTHDTKHGEDVRLRMAALTGMAGEWKSLTHMILLQSPPPDVSLGLRLLQVAVGVWPAHDDGSQILVDVLDEALRDRFVAYALASARGQGVLTTNRDHQPDAEAAVTRWAADVLDPQGSIAGMLRPLAIRAAEVGMASSLSQTLLRLTIPGVPDTYQGTEWWDDSLSAPDNRRPVDFSGRTQSLEALLADGADASDLWANRRNGRVKQHVVQCALRLRQRYPTLLGPTGEYQPIQATGRWAAHMLAFSRGDADGPAIVVVAPRVFGRITDSGRFEPRGRIWADTDIPLPDATAWTDLLTGHTVAGGAVPAASLLATLPVALLLADTHR